MSGRCLACQPLHLKDCQEPECEGCRFRETARSLVVCDGCERRSRDALHELAGIYAGLLERPSSSGPGRSIQVDPVAPLPAGAIEARWDIETLIDRWTTIVINGRGLTRPSFDAVQRTIHEYWSNALCAAALARCGAHHADAKRNLDRAADMRHQLDTGSWWIEHRADLIDRHALWILNSAHAVAFVHQVLHVHGEARHPAEPADNEPVTAPQADPLTLPELRAWLSEHGIDVPDRTLRGWADDRIITAVAGGGRGTARRFDPHAAWLIARSHLTRT